MNENEHNENFSTLDIEYPIRLNRYIAACGVAARRKAEVLISAGRVTVDGVVETSVGRVLDEPAHICVDGNPIGVSRPVYMVLNKPRGVVSAVSDAREQTVIDLLPGFYRTLGLFPVGRLDRESEGLMILTNDGKFAQEIIHPSSGVGRTYHVYVRFEMDASRLEAWRRGVEVDGRHARPLEVRPMDGDDSDKRFIVVLGEGFKREIRMMIRALGNRVVRLQRVGIGQLFLKKLPLGAFCEYNLEEMKNMISRGGEV